MEVNGGLLGVDGDQSVRIVLTSMNAVAIGDIGVDLPES